MPASEVMGKWKSGDLHSGSKSGPVVKSQKQAVAIMLSEKKSDKPEYKSESHNYDSNRPKRQVVSRYSGR